MIVKSDVHKLDSMEDFEQGTFGFTDRSGPCGSEKMPGLKPSAASSAKLRQQTSLAGGASEM